MTLHTIESPPSPRESPQPKYPSVSSELAKSLVRITSDQYHQMMKAGIIEEGAPIELLYGLMVWKDRGDSKEEDPMVHSPEHVLVISLLSGLASRVNGPQRHLKIQLPIHFAQGTEPEPDVSIIRGQPRDYVGGIPAPADVLCLIEVAESSLERDRGDKLQLYAASLIPQYVIINLRANRVEVYSEPNAATGEYRVRTLAAKGQSVQLNLGQREFLEVPAADILP